MSWFRNAWARFFTWVAWWFAPPIEPILISEREMDARDLIGLCIRLRNEQQFNARQAKRITADQHLALLSEQMEEAAPIAPRIYRNASFSLAREQMRQDSDAGVRARKKPLTLKVQG